MRTARQSLRASILRLLFLLACTNHLAGCAWWYLGTVFIPDGFDGERSSDWARHASIPTIDFVDATQEMDPAYLTSGRFAEPMWPNQSYPEGEVAAIPELLEQHIQSQLYSGELLYNQADPGISIPVTDALIETASYTLVMEDLDMEDKIPSIKLNGTWVPLAGAVPSVDEPAAFNSWVMYYQGLGVDALWRKSTSIWTQYLFSFYWASATLSAGGLIGYTTSKTLYEMMFCICCMLLNMTLYAYVLGEISNQV